MTFDPFGAQTDHFGLASTDLILKSSSKEPVAKSRADAQDELGDIADFTVFGHNQTTMFEIECTYVLKAGSLDLATLMLGLLADDPAEVVALSITVTTSNGAFPEVRVTGRMGTDGVTGTFPLPSLTITGTKTAQAMGFTTGAGCHCTGTTAEFSIELTEATNGLGVPVAGAVSGGSYSINADFVNITAAAGWTVTLSGAVETKAPGIMEPDADYSTTSASMEGKLTRGTTTTTTT